MSGGKSEIGSVSVDGVVTIRVGCEAELEEWRTRIGQRIKPPATPRNVDPSECRVVVQSHTYRRVEVTLHRPWPVSFGGGPVSHQDSWPVVTVHIKTKTKAQNANVKAWADMCAASDTWLIPDRKAFAERVLNDALKVGIAHEDMSVRA